MANCIPTVDLSPFFTEGDEDGKNKAMELIKEACTRYGFFQIENHGVPLELLSRALELSKLFYAYSDEEKLKSIGGSDDPGPAGHNKHPEHAPEYNGFLDVFPPVTSCGIYLQNPPGLKEVLEEIFSRLRKIGLLVESIFNDCLGLPPNFLKEYNNDRSADFMTALYYPPATETETNGIMDHEDGNCITFVFQDDVGGLEVEKDGEWIPVIPSPDKLVVNVGDVIQVLSNNKFKSATHRVVRRKGKGRFSYAYFVNLHGDKWVEPLPQFTQEIGEPPKYKGFLFKDYEILRTKIKIHPPAKSADAILCN